MLVNTILETRTLFWYSQNVHYRYFFTGAFVLNIFIFNLSKPNFKYFSPKNYWFFLFGMYLYPSGIYLLWFWDIYLLDVFQEIEYA